MKAAKLLKKNIKGIHIDTTSLDSLKSKGTPTLIFLSVAITIVVMLGFATGFHLSVSSIWIIVAGVAAPALTQLILSRDNNRFKIIALVIAVLAAVIFIVVTIDSFMNGNAEIYNSIVGTINKNMAENHDIFVYEKSDFDIGLAYCFYCALAGIIISVLVKFKRAYTIAVILIISTMANMWFKGEAVTWYIGMAVTLILATIYVSNVRVSPTKKKMVAVWIFAAFFATLSIGVILFVHEFKIESVDDFKDEVSYRLGNVYFGKSDYPEGAFKRFHEHPVTDDETKLKVKLDDPIALHLKGYVGSKYTSKGWESNDENVYGGKFGGILDWIAAEGVYPLEQEANFVYNTVDAKEMELDDVIENKVVIENKNASQKYQYVTESLRSRKGLITPKKDVNFVASVFDKSDKYSFGATSIRDDKYLDYIDTKWINEGNFNSGNQEKYVKSETNYREFAKVAYLDIPNEEKKILTTNIPECNRNVSDAISVVRDYLKGQIKYSRKVKEYDSNKNYLEQILLKDRRGFSPQFASVATLMFRYYGIPSRYAEGYYTANAKKSTDIKLTNKNAHAWVEVYMNGLGFIPVEVTPGFYKEDNEGGGNSMSSIEPPMGGGGSGGAAKAKRQKDIKKEIKEILQVVGLIILALVIAFIVFLIVRRSLIVSRRKNNLKSDDLDLRVGEATKYISQICKVTGDEIEDVLDEDEIELLEKIKFSKHIITEEESERVLTRMVEIPDKKWKEAKLFRKFKMVVWEGLR